MTEQLQNMKLTICQQLNTVTVQLNEQARDWFQRRRELQQLQEQLDMIERAIIAKVTHMSMQEEYKKELSNADKRTAKVQEFLQLDNRKLLDEIKLCKLAVEMSAHLMECTDRLFRMLIAQSRLLGQ